jgi:hypothetical protein
MKARANTTVERISQSRELLPTLSARFPNAGKTRGRRPEDFPILGREKNAVRNISQSWENPRTASGSFPNVGKISGDLRIERFFNNSSRYNKILKHILTNRSAYETD